MMAWKNDIAGCAYCLWRSLYAAASVPPTFLDWYPSALIIHGMVEMQACKKHEHELAAVLLKSEDGWVVDSSDGGR